MPINAQVPTVPQTPRPLLARYPKLAAAVPHVPLATLPTPVEPMPKLAEAIGAPGLYIKRDDLTGDIYGGNKVRKLEFLLGDALARGVDLVMTFGYAGSNHATATAIYANRVGLRSRSMLLPQSNAHYVRKNLLASYRAGAILRQYSNAKWVRAAAIWVAFLERLKGRKAPAIIAPGGSSPLGILGIVNAAFELADQIERGECPRPDRIYVALGSMGTAVGLAIGLRAASLDCALVPVLVTGPDFASDAKLDRLLEKTVAFIRDRDDTFPALSIRAEDLSVRKEFFGKQYALFTEAGAQALALTKQHEGIVLDGTYSGKAMAALVADARSGKLREGTTLFWDTYNSRDLKGYIGSLDPSELPEEFQSYFTKPVQPLDSPS